MSKLWALLFGVAFYNCCAAQQRAGAIQISFEFVSKDSNSILNRKLVNDFGETYKISKLKYYVSNVRFETGDKKQMNREVFLIDAAKQNSISIKMPFRKITGISFLLGVDSILNCSGAQSGALDPLNDMFWTWNNGYIFFKLEGSSDVSTGDLNRIEHHIGGFKGVNKTIRTAYLPINNTALLKQKKLVIQLDINRYWNGVNKLKIAEMPVVALPGTQAKTAADNFAGMFSIKNNL